MTSTATPKIQRLQSISASLPTPLPSHTPARVRPSMANMQSPHDMIASPTHDGAITSSMIGSSSTTGSSAASAASAGKENTSVLVRLRPDLENHQSGASKDKAVWVDDYSRQVVITRPGTSEAKRFNFDGVFGPDTTQAEVWPHVQRFVDAAMKGYNGTIFAYGQTGSGKTHTMLGPIAELTKEDSINRGIIPRLLQALFDAASQKQAAELVTIEITVESLEIYNETIRDLLNERGQGNLEVKSLPTPHVPGITRQTVTNYQAALQLLAQASKTRTVGATKMNDQSSRSHSVFTLNIHITYLDTKVKSTSRINLVDLAGSESQKTAQTHGERLKEAGNINKSLSTLIGYISYLSNGKNYISARNSKLTLLLSDSIGGNSRTTLIATINPSVDVFSDSMNTLNFAATAKEVKGDVKQNVLVNGSRVDAVALQKRLEKYIAENEALRNDAANFDGKMSEERLAHLAEGRALLSLIDLHVDQSIASLDQETKREEVEGIARETIEEYEQHTHYLEAQLEAYQASNAELQQGERQLQSDLDSLSAVETSLRVRLASVESSEAALKNEFDQKEQALKEALATGSQSEQAAAERAAALGAEVKSLSLSLESTTAQLNTEKGTRAKLEESVRRSSENFQKAQSLNQTKLAQVKEQSQKVTNEYRNLLMEARESLAKERESHLRTQTQGKRVEEFNREKNAYLLESKKNLAQEALSKEKEAMQLPAPRFEFQEIPRQSFDIDEEQMQGFWQEFQAELEEAQAQAPPSNLLQLAQQQLVLPLGCDAPLQPIAGAAPASRLSLTPASNRKPLGERQNMQSASPAVVGNSASKLNVSKQHMRSPSVQMTVHEDITSPTKRRASTAAPSSVVLRRSGAEESWSKLIDPIDQELRKKSALLDDEMDTPPVFIEEPFTQLTSPNGRPIVAHTTPSRQFR